MYGLKQKNMQLIVNNPNETYSQLMTLVYFVQVHMKFIVSVVKSVVGALISTGCSIVKCTDRNH